MNDTRFLKYLWVIKGGAIFDSGEPLGYYIVTQDAEAREKYHWPEWEITICKIHDKEIAELIVSAVNDKLGFK